MRSEKATSVLCSPPRYLQMDTFLMIMICASARFPFNQIEFNSYTYHGNALNSLTDGEWLARKGVGRVRIIPAYNVSIDVFVTHTAADPDPSYNYNNEFYRQKQVEELIGTYLNESTADVILLGGDFNAGPDTKEGEALR